jgi:hypothetical protein
MVRDLLMIGSDAGVIFILELPGAATKAFMRCT